MSEIPLPWFGSGQDPGPSFSDLLRRVAPEAHPEARIPEIVSATAGTAGGPEIPHGTTVVALRFADGVVMGGDRRATEGYSIAGRRMEKVQAADNWSGVAIAGAAGPAMEMVRLFQTQLEHYEKVEGEPLTMEGKANQLAQMVRGNFPAALQGLVVVPLFAGYDLHRERGRLFKYDVAGGRYEELDFHTTGSGSIHARNWMKNLWREGLSRDDAVDVALRALLNAADEDSATGGADLVRGIYPTIAVINADGYQPLTDADIAARVGAILDEIRAALEQGSTT